MKSTLQTPRSGSLRSNRPPFWALRAFATALQRLPIGRQTPIAVNEAAAAETVGMVAALNESVAADGEWTRIAPYRPIPNKVGLQVFDRTGADAMVQAFNSFAGTLSRGFRGLPVFVGHPDDPEWAKQNPAVKPEAVGRIKELEARDDGLYGKIAFNEEGKRLTGGDAAAYAFHSPRWSMRPIQHQGRTAYRPVILHSIGLTNTPNISDNTIGSNEADNFFATMKPQIIALLAALGRPVSNPSAVTDEQLAAAVNEATPVATQLVTSSNELGTVRTQLTTANNDLASARTKLTQAETDLAAARTSARNERAARVDVSLTTAINTGRITEAQRGDWKTKLTGSTDYAATEGELMKLKVTVNTKGRVTDAGTRKNEGTADSDAITAINTAVSKHIKENGLDARKDYNRAYAEVKKAQPALFETVA